MQTMRRASVRNGLGSWLLAACLVTSAGAQPNPDEIEVLLPSGWPTQTTAHVELLDEPQSVVVETQRLRACRADDVLGLTVTPGLRRTVVLYRIERHAPGRFSLFGKTPNGHGDFSMAIVDDVAAGLLVCREGTFSIRYLGDDRHVVGRVTPALDRGCGTEDPDPVDHARHLDTHEHEPPRDDAAMLRGSGDCNQPGPIFDTVIAYSDVARSAAGGTAAIQALAQNAVNVTNVAYTNSLVQPAIATGPARMQLLFTSELAYDENGSYSDHRARLVSTSDGILDQAHVWRNLYGADVVALLVDDGALCGLAECTPADDTEGFHVTNWQCAGPNFSFAHETAHLQGCAHNREAAGSCNQFSYSYGHRYFDPNSMGRRTIMGVNDGAGTYTRIQYFSTPNVTFQGAVVGVAPGLPNEAFNAQTIINQSSGVSGWRAPKFDVWVDFDYLGPENGSFIEPWNSIVDGVAATFDDSAGTALTMPRLRIKAGGALGGTTIQKPLLLRACGGTAVIGAVQ